ncbi:MAG: UDP-3-O-acyl-N-acetylglucosamine deacetylase [Proteobacteria bacterium]|nr:UDP-3-O-acyl-N-acetylglucosamine deacetylase [Pseudomonadota bacterium]
MKKLMQRTLKKSVEASGIGLHSGRTVYLRLDPAPVDTGIVFRRTDVGAEFKVTPDCVMDTMLCTKMGNAEGVTVSTVEHLMSALYGVGVDNVIVSLDAEEIPIFDGSAAPFVYLLEDAGLVAQEKAKKVIKVMRKVEVKDGDKRASFSPSDHFSVSLELDYNHPIVPAQSNKFLINGDFYRSGIARARTFCFQGDVEKMQSVGLALGGGLDNAIVVGDFSILNSTGLRYNDEFMRHKVLDCIGDLYMIGHPIIGAFEARMTGHGLNNKLLRALMADPMNYRFMEVPSDSDVLPLAPIEVAA